MEIPPALALFYNWTSLDGDVYEYYVAEYQTCYSIWITSEATSLFCDHALERKVIKTVLVKYHDYSSLLRLLQQPVTEDIELRLCRDQHDVLENDGIFLGNLEIYAW